jgi:hypothetical protein
MADKRVLQEIRMTAHPCWEPPAAEAAFSAGTYQVLRELPYLSGGYHLLQAVAPERAEAASPDGSVAPEGHHDAVVGRAGQAATTCKLTMGSHSSFYSSKIAPTSPVMAA